MHRRGLLDLQRGGRGGNSNGLYGWWRLWHYRQLARSWRVKGRIDLTHDFFHGAVDVVKERLGIDADPECQSHEGQKHSVLTEVQVWKRFVHFVSHRAKHGALVEPEEIGGAENDAQGAPSGPGFADHESALQNGELADEAVQKRHAERTEADDKIDSRKVRHGSGEAAELRDKARVAAFVQNAHDEEECARGDAVIDLLEHATGKAIGREGENAEGAEPKVADRTVGDQALHIFLHEADDGAVDDAYQRKYDEDVNDLAA